MRLISILFFIGVLMVPLISSQTDSPTSDDDFTLPTLADLRANLKDLWENYKKGFGIIFKTTADEIHRIRIFKKHVKMIIKHNLEYDLGLHTYRLGITNHTELTTEEFREKFLGYKKDGNSTWEDSKLQSTFVSTPSQTTLPISIDWRDQNIITSVKNQGPCGSCWAFSTLGTLEAYYARITGKILDLSEQQLMDCSTRYGNHGCQGGFLSETYRYIYDNGGVTSEQNYPFTGMNGATCRAGQYPPIATVANIVRIPSGNEQALTQALGLHGPVAVAMHGSLESFRFYRSGVFSDPQCSARHLDHAVVAVGYGVEFSPIKGQQEYYLIKNSWSTAWGDKGYAKIARNSNNLCGLSTDAVYPVLREELFQANTMSN